MAKEDTQFKKGNPGGPGRPKGGRRLTLEALDKMLAKADNLKQFEEELQIEFSKDALAFWKTYVFPLMPKDLRLVDEDDNPILGFNVTIKDSRDDS